MSMVTKRAIVIRVGQDQLSLRINPRAIVIGMVLVFLCLALAITSLTMGDYPISVAAVAGVIFGHGDDITRMIVTEWRLPRILLAVLLGSALGMSGAIFQSLTRNPLGSPDVIGFSTGSYTGALVVMLLLSGGTVETAIGALCGGFMTALVIYALAHRNGIQGFRLIVVGIGVSAVLAAVNAWMIRKADLQIAMSAAMWGAGSLNDIGEEQLLPVLIIMCVAIPLVLRLDRPMRQLELGDDVARATGVNAKRVRFFAMGLGVALTATVTAVAGPIAFIALVAPQIAKRLTRCDGIVLIPSGLAGGLLLLAADGIAQHGFGTQLPVGVMTVSLGGFYFLWLIIREGRQ
ncbi:FecCD family ABC transporter permease [Agrobacterium sp.]|uniref:FecCD family ABC transporter permease n=1 Tax=Agrobacterium sp. TaxID=361 RepID=UPI0028AB5DBF|nr:iron chelate uptake ABC transporter family permease subunit [Agrobacterium sp.]